MTQPLIGLTAFRQWNLRGDPVLSINEAYTSAILRAGGIPVVIPLGLPESYLEALLPRLDGVVFTGGGDIHPDRYSSKMHPAVDDVDVDRDRVETHLFQQTLQSERPFLGICRGLQLVNVALGGSLYEDILDQHTGSIKHRYYPDWPRDYIAHDVRVETGSRLEKIVGQNSLPVNSLHHQGIRRLAGPLLATAFASDGIVEAVELKDYPYGLAVQWHPEWLPKHAPMQAIFSDFIHACQPTGH